MPIRRQAGSLRWLHWPRRTARLRFTAVYGSLFLLSGAALVAITYALFERATRYTKPALPRIPPAPSLQHVELPTLKGPALPSQLPQALSNVANDQHQLIELQHRLAALSVPGPAKGSALDHPKLQVVPSGLRSALSQLSRDEHQLTQSQHQLTGAVHQLSRAVHQVAQAASAQATLRAADSHQLLVNSGIALGIVAVLALLGAWLVAGRMLRPIRTITRTARRISSTNLVERLALDGPQDELKELGDTLDDLFGRLETAFEAQQHFVANASHELRTPITAERNLLQVALDDPDTSAQGWRDTAQELLACNDEQKHLIEALLALASSESGLDRRERTDLADVCHTVLPRPGSDTEALELQLQTTIRAASLDGDPRLIARLVTNLVDNAIGHNVAGGQVSISTDTRDGKAVLRVSNTGPVIPPGELTRLFQPFQRLDPRRAHHKSGHGLGLSIVQAIANAHHATISAEPQAEGGLSVTVAFPPPTEPATRTRKVRGTLQLAAGG